MNDVAVVDLFAGAGGWDEGLLDLAVPEVVGLEISEDACATAVSAGHRRELMDVTEVDPKDYIGIDGLLASPPCQDWSSAGRAGESGTRDLTDETLRWVAAVKPQWAAFEQVRDVLPTWQHQASSLRDMGYQTWVGLVDAADYGVPQHRVRAILLAHYDFQPQAPRRTHAAQQTLDGLPRWRTMADALGWDGTLDRRNNGAPVLRVDRPAPTVTGVGIGSGQWLYTPEGGEPCAVTIEEGAALQGFRPTYPWKGSTKKSRGQQVGNAVPPALAAALLRQFVVAASKQEDETDG